jgi:hypothetical protein
MVSGLLVEIKIMHNAKLILYLLFLLLQASMARSQSYFPVPSPPDPWSLSKNVGGTMTLLSQSTTNVRQEVRILVYGQSISVQDWWKEVKQFLEKKYPNVQLTMINMAVGGFSTERLKLIVENDVRSFYPDLILLHDYGNAEDYERIIQSIRRHTTAEVAIQTDHIAVGQNEEWHSKHNTNTLPALAKKYNLALIDVRTAWKEYLEKNKLPASALLSDNVHLNEHGNYLMAGIIKNYFNSLPTPAGNIPGNTYTVLQAGKNFTVKNNMLTVQVTGNRIDLVWGKAVKSKEPVAVTLDAKKPSAYTQSYSFTRPVLSPSKEYLGKMGKLLTLGLGNVAGEEDWTLHILAVDTGQMQMRFRVHGSIVGEDGTGSSDSLFTSRSGRIRIEPGQWFLRKSPGDFKMFPWIKPGDKLAWQVKSMSRDMAEPQPSGVVTVVQGVANSPHVLMLKGKSLLHLKEIRVYQPPLKE